MPFSKPDLRKELIARRKAVSQADAQEAAQKLAGHLQRHLAAHPVRVIAGYLPMQGEIDIIPAMESLIKIGHRFCLPAVGQGRVLRFYTWRPGEELVTGAHGTRTPAPSAPECTPDMLIVPLVGFDAAGGRLGYGGGYYDSTIEALRRQNSSVNIIGAAYDCQRVEMLPRETHDAPLDAVATESGIAFFAQQSKT